MSFVLTDARSGHEITFLTWDELIKPGSHLELSMLVDENDPGLVFCSNTRCKMVPNAATRDEKEPW